MRKKKIQQQIGIQLSLFREQVVSYRPNTSTRSGTTKEYVGRTMFFSLLSRNRVLSENLLERVLEPRNMNKAYKAVKSNGGKSGVDEMEVEELGRWLQDNLEDLRVQILSESYEPSSVLGIEIPKSSGGTRLLGIPTVLDRFIQQCIHQELTLLYEPLFSEHSYGFRPNRSALQAVSQASGYVSEGYEWVVDIDLKSFFDHIQHDRLMQRLHKGVGDKRLLRLIRKYLRAGMLKGGLVQQRTSGTPQGGPLSPLLSNIVLDELDKELESRGHKFVRYADDCNIYVKSEAAGKRVLESITRFIEGKLKLLVNAQKSGVRHCSSVKFLGYTIMPGEGIRIADKSKQRFKKKIRKLTKRNRGVRFSTVIEEVNAATRGWVQYFRLANCWLPWKELDGWIRRRLRCYRLKQCKRKHTLFKFLRRLGASKHKAWNAVLYGGSWWPLSKRVVCQKGMNLKWFDKQGLESLSYWHNRFNC